MKKGLTKLILSGAAVAAVAATLGTSTYAWYVANDTVKATGIEGASAATSAASIFISRNSTDWGSEVSLSGNIASGDIDATKYTLGGVGDPWVRGNNLLPVEYAGVSAGADTFKLLGTESSGTYTAQTTTTSIADGAAKQFTLFFRTSKVASAADAPNVYLKSLTITNAATNAGALPAADNLNFNGDAAVGGVGTSNSQYKVDIRHALGLTIYSTATGANVGNVNGNTFDPESRTTPYSSTGVTDGSADALAYYNKYMNTNYTYAMNTNPKKEIKASNYTAGTGETVSPINLGKLDYTGETYITVTFSIYLDGWDTFCFDACKGQTFGFDLQFTSDADEALKFVSATA
jgi:hypothetical protein